MFVILIQYAVIKHLQKSTNKSKKRMCTMKKVGILVGSLRQESFTKKVAKNVQPLFSDEVETEWLDIGKLPLYNQDVDSQTELPDEIVQLREKAREKDGCIVLNPEYNRCVTGVLKNSLDGGSRPQYARWGNDRP